MERSTRLLHLENSTPKFIRNRLTLSAVIVAEKTLGNYEFGED